MLVPQNAERPCPTGDFKAHIKRANRRRRRMQRLLQRAYH